MSDTSPSPPRRTRLVPRGTDDRLQVVKTGLDTHRRHDLYVWLLDVPWKTLLGCIAIMYLGINICFAFAYFLIGNIENATPGSFADVFFFSIQTMSTIGYGKMDPIGITTNLLVTFEVITGFVFFAVVTGLVFAKFSRPTARVIFSNVAVICPYEGKPHLMLRLANERSNRIVDANIHLVLLRRETSKEGHVMRRFHDLSLARSRVPLLQLTWTLMHPIDETSPLYNITPELLREWDAEIIVSLVGMDETLSQTIHARYSYIAEDIHCNAAFADIITRSDDGRLDVDYNRFHDTKALPPEHQIVCA